LPDLRVNLSAGEKVQFVVRRGFPAPGAGAPSPSGEAEYAWSVTGAQARWVAVSATTPPRTFREEERIPLFPLVFRERDDRPRRLWAGVLPIGQGEFYRHADRVTRDGQTITADANLEVWLTARCLYTRPQCAAPRGEIVSDSSAPFQIAPLDDLDVAGRSWPPSLAGEA
jgi:hypothetical protein